MLLLLYRQEKGQCECLEWRGLQKGASDLFLSSGERRKEGIHWLKWNIFRRAAITKRWWWPPCQGCPATPRAPPHLLLSSRPSLVYKEREAELEAFSANAPPLYTHSVWSVVLPTREAFFSMLTSVLELWYWNESRWLHYYLSKWRFSTFHWSNPRLSPHPAQLLDL